jgi:hypothetical protein
VISASAREQVNGDRLARSKSRKVRVAAPPVRNRAGNSAGSALKRLIGRDYRVTPPSRNRSNGVPLARDEPLTAQVCTLSIYCLAMGPRQH